MQDIMSFLASVKCYMEWNHQMVYALQRDQMKGFDYLALQDSMMLLMHMVSRHQSSTLTRLLKVTQRFLSESHME